MLYVSFNKTFFASNIDNSLQNILQAHNAFCIWDDICT